MEETVIRGANLAYGAEEHGFKIVADEDVAGEWEFDTVLVVRDPAGKLWAAHDSGCSCPEPFEDVTWPTDWVEIKTLEDLNGPFGQWYHGDTELARARVRDAVAAVL